jgi:nitroreductase
MSLSGSTPKGAQLEQLKHAASQLPVLDVIQKRWSPRAFADKEVTTHDLQTIFTAASWAASANNEQPWRFVVGRKGDGVFSKILESLMELNQAWAKDAPVLYAVFAKKTMDTWNGAPNPVAMHDVGAASAHAALQATALGLHTHGMAGFDSSKLRANIALPDDFDPVAVWALGHLGDPDVLPEAYKQREIVPRTRKSLNEFVFGEWGKPAVA